MPLLLKHQNIPTEKEMKLTLRQQSLNALLSSLQECASIKKKQKPEIFEMAVGGKDIKEKYEFIKSKLGQKIPVSDVLKPGELLDVISVTTGHGFTGSVKRFGVFVSRSKTEKVKRKVMTMGLKAPSKTRPTTPQFGQYGFFTRCEYNKLILKVSNH